MIVCQHKPSTYSGSFTLELQKKKTLTIAVANRTQLINKTTVNANNVNLKLFLYRKQINKSLSLLI